MLFSDKLENAVRSKKSCLMLNLDPNPDKMPDHFPKNAEGCFEFCKQVIEATQDYICGVKPQMAYFEVFGSKGIKAVEELLKIAKSKDLISVIDGKRNDIGSTCEAYAKTYLEDGPLSGDALTVNPFLGTDGITPFIKRCEIFGKGIFVLVRTSNPSAIEFQGGETEISVRIAEKVEEWNVTTQSKKNNFTSVGAVIGATLEPDLIKFFREEMPHAWFLMPGVGAQGGNINSILNVQKNGLGVLIPVGRSILYAGTGKNFSKDSKKVVQKLFELQSHKV